MHAVVIGGGIIGLFSAWYLQEAGWKVTVVDRGDLLTGCSYGNAGMITPSHFVPLAAPGVLKQGIRWMFSRSSPFSIRPRFNAGMARWGLHFMRHASAAHAARSAVPLRDLLLMGRDLYEELAAGALDLHLERKGIIMYFQSEAVGEEEKALAEKARQLGLETEVYDSRQLKELEPEMEVNALGGVHYKSDAHLYPPELIRQLIVQLREKVSWVRMKAEKFEKSPGKVLAVVGQGTSVPGDLFVLSAGSWSGELAAALGLRLPLMPGKGYSVTVEKPRVLPRHPAILCEARVAITPMNGMLRFGGTMEIGAARERINLRRVQAIVNSVNGYFPGLQVKMPARERVWAGLRPVSADGLPYIGKFPEYGNLIVATGHAMMGLGMAPATGKLVAELAGERKPSVDLAPFRPGRF